MAPLNGRLPAGDLATIPGTPHVIRADLVDQFVAWRGAFQAEFGRPMVVTSAYRAYSGHTYAQVELYLRRNRTYAQMRALGYSHTFILSRRSTVWNGVRRYLLPSQAQAAVPGTSNHGWATAVDLGSGVNIGGSDEWNWCVDIAPRFGFRWPSEWARRAREWWHFEDGQLVSQSVYAHIPGALTGAPSGQQSDTITPEEDELMAVRIRNSTNGSMYSVCLQTGLFSGIPNPEFNSVLGDSVAGKVRNVGQREFDIIRQQCQIALERLTGRPSVVEADGSIRVG